MPRSNSDADENESLTSDGEDVAPRPQDPISPKSQTFSQNARRTNHRRSTVQTGSSRIDPSAKPIDKFRAAVHQVIKIQKTQLALKDLSFGAGGQEPQGSTLQDLYGQYRQNCRVDVWDYGPTKSRLQEFDTNYKFIHWLETEGSTQRGLWSKVRWINISGRSGDILEALQQRYGLHPLSLDVVINGRDNARSKADYFAQHLFIHILSHKLAQDDDQGTIKSPLSQEPDTIASPRQSKSFDPENGVPHLRSRPIRSETMATIDEDLEKPDLENARTRLGLDGQEESAEEKAYRNKQLNMQAIDTLKHGTGQVKVDVKSVFMFLLRDGTLITIQRDPAREFGIPIYERLRLRDTLLRSSGDASLLLQSLIDLIVDEAVKIADKYHRRLLKMERDILLKPKMRTVRDLHIASGDLMLHKRTMGPISQLVYGLRRYDTDRVKAVVQHDADHPPVGFLSHQSKVYLADVHDHIEYIISSLDMFSSIAENLINYTFNLVSYETNQVMRGLTVATVIFFPLTFLTGYFGMNFHIMPSVQEHSEAMFWEIAAPVMVTVIGLFLYPDLQRFVHFLKKRAATSKYKTTS